jgi:hypothetical protein
MTPHCPDPRKFGFFGLVLALAGVVFLSNGCATAPMVCPSATQVMQAKGYRVLQCKPYIYLDNGEASTICYVEDLDGNRKVRTVFAKHCGL